MVDIKDIKIDTSPTYRHRHRRGSGLGRGMIRLLFFLGTLIPTCIIAWRIDLVNPRQEPPQVDPQSSAVPQRPPPVRKSPSPKAPPAVRAKSPRNAEARSETVRAHRRDGTAAETDPDEVEIPLAKARATSQNRQVPKPRIESRLDERRDTDTREIKAFKEALASHDDSKFVAATDAVLESDASGKTIQSIIEEVVQSGNDLQIGRALFALGEVATKSDWPIKTLVRMQARLCGSNRRLIDPRPMHHIDTGMGLDAEVYFGPIFDQSSPYDSLLNDWYRVENPTNTRALADRFRKMELYREANRLLAEFVRHDKRIEKLFDQRLDQLKNSPPPEERSKAAFGLSRAEAISVDAIPALLEALKNDKSGSVRLVAAVSLAGFGKAAAPAAPMIAKGVQEAEQNQVRHILLFALVDIDPDSTHLRKAVREVLEEYRKSRDPNIWHTLVPACNTLSILGPKGDWAVPQLIDAATFAMNRAQDVEVKATTVALTNVGPSDARVVRFYERAATEGPAQFRVYCDSVAKQLRLQNRP